MPSIGSETPMTDQPTTQAGQEWLTYFPETAFPSVHARQRILAIEAEARAQQEAFRAAEQAAEQGAWMDLTTDRDMERAYRQDLERVIRDMLAAGGNLPDWFRSQRSEVPEGLLESGEA